MDMLEAGEKLMSCQKLQDLFYMVLMAGNFLNSVSHHLFRIIAKSQNLYTYTVFVVWYSDRRSYDSFGGKWFMNTNQYHLVFQKKNWKGKKRILECSKLPQIGTTLELEQL